MIICAEYNFGAWPVYQKMGTVPVNAANAASAPQQSDSAESLCWKAVELGVPVTYSAIPMTKPEGKSFAERWAYHRQCLERLVAAAEKASTSVAAVLLDNEVQATTAEAKEARFLEAMAWRAMIHEYLPTVEIINYRWNHCGYWIPGKAKWEKYRYWGLDENGEVVEPRSVVDCVCYYPHRFRDTFIQVNTATQEAQKARLPLAVWFSLGVGYADNGSTFGPVDYAVEDSAFYRQLLDRLADYVCLYPSPGHEKYQAAMGPHLEAFLGG